MIKTDDFLEGLKNAGITFISGVPDSLLKDICACITSNLPSNQHIIATNEGSAVALGIGHYLATSSPALIYMQNSGLGNTINPLTSLADPDVYAIPMILMVGWRGEIQEDGIQLHDEPQHKKQGQVTLKQLDTLDIPYQILDQQVDNIDNVLKILSEQAIRRSGPVALVVRKATFQAFQLDKPAVNQNLPSRKQAIETILSNLPDNTAIVSTTGFASREVFEQRKKLKQGHHRDFLTVGGMGHASQIAVGIAMSKPKLKIICIDGDGAVLMHSGALAINADCHNLIHIVINNGVHDSVGGQPTKGATLDFNTIAQAYNYPITFSIDSIVKLEEVLQQALNKLGPVLLEVKCKPGAASDLGRPDRTPIENKKEFMMFLEEKL